MLLVVYAPHCATDNVLDAQIWRDLLNDLAGCLLHLLFSFYEGEALWFDIRMIKGDHATEGRPLDNIKLKLKQRK